MMNFANAMRDLGRPRNIAEALRAIRTTEGRGASRVLADRLGVSLRQAQRYLKGDIKRPPADKERTIRESADRRVIAASALAGAQTVSVGKVSVTDSGGRGGSRNIGTLPVDASLRQDLNEVSRLYGEGKDREAEAAMNRAVMGGYSRSKNDNRTVAAGALTVSDYGAGIDVG